jgi:hypothetical protein
LVFIEEEEATRVGIENALPFAHANITVSHSRKRKFCAIRVTPPSML